MRLRSSQPGGEQKATVIIPQQLVKQGCYGEGDQCSGQSDL